MTFGTHRRNDHEPGFIYLIEAEGVHGIIPGKFIRRCKIGLSRDPELRRMNFVEAQFPVNVEIITTIYVEDMAEVEKELHQIFQKYNVKLEKSREWFDLNPWQFIKCLYEFRQREAIVFSISDIPIKAVAIGLVAFIGFTAIGTLGYQQLKSVEAVPVKTK